MMGEAEIHKKFEILTAEHDEMMKSNDEDKKAQDILIGLLKDE